MPRGEAIKKYEEIRIYSSHLMQQKEVFNIYRDFYRDATQYFFHSSFIE